MSQALVTGLMRRSTADAWVQVEGWKRTMRQSMCTLVLIAAFGLQSPAASSAAAETEGPETLVTGFVRAWNAHDMKAFGSLFAEDADFINVVGMWWKGRAEIQAKHEATHASRFKTTTLVATNTAVRLLGSDVGVLHFSWELTGELDPDGKALPPRRGIMQIVAARRADGWRIIAAQNTNTAAPR